MILEEVFQQLQIDTDITGYLALDQSKMSTFDHFRFQDAYFEVDMPADEWDDFDLEVELDIGPSIPGMNA